nr:PREDICTED: ubiquinone biosynthesis O-methyltransferase, mitochondrial [Lepisosteus oculatus]
MSKNIVPVIFRLGFETKSEYRCLLSRLALTPAVVSARALFFLSAGNENQINYTKRQASGAPVFTPVSWRMRPSITRMSSATQTTLDPDEMKRFQSLASKWWNEQGEFAALHAMNDLRVPFIRDNLLNLSGGRKLGCPLSGFKILDVGCGGGLLSEPLGRLGASVVGIDPLEESIQTAELHKSFEPVLSKQVQYRACLLEDIAEESRQVFDAVVASEVVEHVNDLETFIKCCLDVLKPGGSLFITTINKTNLSYVLGIVVAERVLKIVPNGTHDWEKFINPVDLERLLESNGFCVESIHGMLYNPVSGSWSWTKSTSLNYAVHAVKQKEQPQSDFTKRSEDQEQWDNSQ